MVYAKISRIFFRRATGYRERGEKFFYENVWGAFARKNKPLPVAF